MDLKSPLRIGDRDWEIKRHLGTPGGQSAAIYQVGSGTDLAVLKVARAHDFGHLQSECHAIKKLRKDPLVGTNVRGLVCEDVVALTVKEPKSYGLLLEYWHASLHENKDQLSLLQRLKLLRLVRTWVQALHGQGYSHGDLKPGNILMNGLANGDPQPKDWAASDVGDSAGTSAYLPPDGGSDLPDRDRYALGKISLDLVPALVRPDLESHLAEVQQVWKLEPNFLLALREAWDEWQPVLKAVEQLREQAARYVQDERRQRPRDLQALGDGLDAAVAALERPLRRLPAAALIGAQEPEVPSLNIVMGPSAAAPAEPAILGARSWWQSLFGGGAPPTAREVVAAVPTRPKAKPDAGVSARPAAASSAGNPPVKPAGPAPSPPLPPRIDGAAPRSSAATQAAPTAAKPPAGPAPAPSSPRPPAPGTVVYTALPEVAPLPMVYIPAGRFWMGSPDGEGRDDEHPRHQVEVAAFLAGATLITQAQWLAVAKLSPDLSSHFHFRHDPTGRLPAENVSWFDAVRFCNALSQSERRKPAYLLDGDPKVPTVRVVAGADGYTLLTEAQWEYAARAGTTTRWWTGDDEASLGQAAWYGTNPGTTHPVATKAPNPWGLFDVHGNVWEWVWDVYRVSYANGAGTSERAPSASDPAAGRVLRGGCYGYDAFWTRSANRVRGSPDYRDGNLGFRVALPAAPLGRGV